MAGVGTIPAMVSQLQRWTAAAVMAAAGLVIGACGGADGSENNDAGGYGSAESGGSEAPSGQQVEVAGKEFSYTPSTLTLKAGLPTTIVLKNTGSIEHDITVDKADFKLTVNAGKEGKKALTMQDAGTHKFYCSIPGHESAGMKGELKVE